jgi:hypothetical protein
MLRYHGEALIEHEFECVVVRAHDETPPPEVWSPVSNGLHQVDQLPLISGKLQVPGCEWPVEESDGARTLVKHRAEVGAGRVALHGERLLEVWQVKNRGCGQRTLEGVERRRGLLG